VTALDVRAMRRWGKGVGNIRVVILKKRRSGAISELYPDVCYSTTACHTCLDVEKMRVRSLDLGVMPLRGGVIFWRQAA
jgi:hypothetical protein